jgi:hypothetical protein
LANLVGLGLASAAGLEVEDLRDAVAAEDVVTAAALALVKAEAAEEGAEVVEAEGAVGGSAEEAREKFGVASHAGELTPAQRYVAS